MTILNERTCLDTNVFIFGLRKVHPPSVELLTHLERVNLIVPARVLKELAANFPGLPFRVLSPEAALAEVTLP